jgi:hypothetical protein
LVSNVLPREGDGADCCGAQQQEDVLSHGGPCSLNPDDSCSSCGSSPIFVATIRSVSRTVESSKGSDPCARPFTAAVAVAAAATTARTAAGDLAVAEEVSIEDVEWLADSSSCKRQTSRSSSRSTAPHTCSPSLADGGPMEEGSAHEVNCIPDCRLQYKRCQDNLSTTANQHMAMDCLVAGDCSRGSCSRSGDGAWAAQQQDDTACAPRPQPQSSQAGKEHHREQHKEQQAGQLRQRRLQDSIAATQGTGSSTRPALLQVPMGQLGKQSGQQPPSPGLVSRAGSKAAALQVGG